ncbi:MAG: hypothetical protein WAV50_03495 [Minisyncoccia bacterium]
MNTKIELVSSNKISNAAYNLLAQARSILGDDLITAEDIHKATLSHVSYHYGHLAHLMDTLPSIKVLKVLKENGFGLVPYSPEVLDCRSITASSWLALMKAAPKETQGRILREQVKYFRGKGFLGYVPGKADVAWFEQMFRHVRGERLFKDPVRTSTKGADGYVCIRSGGIASCTSSTYADLRLGLAVMFARLPRT